MRKRLLALSVKSLLRLSVLGGIVSLVIAGKGWYVPRHARASMLDNPVPLHGATSCSNGKWAFSGGNYYGLRMIDVIPESATRIVSWYESRGWKAEVVRGVISYRARAIHRPTHRYWMNISFDANAAIAPIGDTGAYVQQTYVMTVCPPMIFLEH